jgi:Tol biopolymer transport system component
VFPEFRGRYLGQSPPGLTPEIFAPGIVNTEAKNHSAVAISLDGDEIYWSQFSYIGDMRQERIWFTKTEDGAWIRPRVAPFSGEYRDGQPVFSPDGARLYFSSLRPREGETEAGDANIWFMTRAGQKWNGPFCLKQAINSEDQEWFPSVARNGNLYFARNYRESSTSWDIYCSRYVDDRYLKSQRLGDAVNSVFCDATPFIDPDEKYLIFFSERPDGVFESGRLHTSFRRDDGTWAPAKKIGLTFNSVPTRFPSMTLDGKYFFFTSLGSKTEDVYWVDASVFVELVPYGH